MTRSHRRRRTRLANPNLSPNPDPNLNPYPNPNPNQDYDDAFEDEGGADPAGDDGVAMGFLSLRRTTSRDEARGESWPLPRIPHLTP